MTEETPKKSKQAKRLSKAKQRLIERGLEILDNPNAPPDPAYMARELVQCTLPYKNPGDVPAWTRRNGNLSLGIQPGWDYKNDTCIGFPYGTIPRLLLFWLTTEAVKKKSRHIQLGESLSQFMRELGLDPSRGGKRSDARRLRDQMTRLFNARISFQREISRATKLPNGTISRERQNGEAWLNMEIAPRGELWWSEERPEQPTLWESWIELGEDFYRAITSSPVPVDMKTLRELKNSPLALDLYAWLTHEAYRVYRKGEPRFVSWSLLMEQFGTGYTDPKNFGRDAREALRKIEAGYPLLKLGELRGGVTIEPESFPSIRPKKPPLLPS
jgi:hypothetical protein